MADREKAIGRPVPFEIADMLKRGNITKKDRKELLRYYNFRNEFVKTGEGAPLPEEGLERRFLVDFNGEYYRQAISGLPMEFLRLSTHALNFAQFLREGASEDTRDEETEEFASGYEHIAYGISEAFEDLAETVTDMEDNRAHSYTMSRGGFLKLFEMLGAFLMTANDILGFFLDNETEEHFLDDSEVEETLERFGLEADKQTEAEKETASNLHRLVFSLDVSKPKN